NPPSPPFAKGGQGGISNSTFILHPLTLSKVFFSDNGSTAVEIGLKMAFQFWQHSGVRRKKKFLSLDNAYHGDTIGAVSVGGIDIFHRLFSPLLFKSYKAPSPYCYRCVLGKKYPSCRLLCLKKMEEVMKKHHKDIAGVIIEPLVQGAGGMIVSPYGYLKGVRKLCTKYNILMIADEVATGFGRTGKMFACGQILKKELVKISDFPHVGDVRQKGFMAGIELVKNKKTKEPYKAEEKIGWKVCCIAREKGLIIRPLGNIIVMMPPLSISNQELESLVQITAESIKEATG
ncbi:MAG: aminotransferase class III-fold pyridoxal phosphate-dependent enzyme, partial [Nitrospirae bacterium]|nr:aminotransferase class III-fold pyridoxal phosphate-dependent enzyme [Nitrospirota bacterium]